MQMTKGAVHMEQQITSAPAEAVEVEATWFNKTGESRERRCYNGEEVD